MTATTVPEEHVDPAPSVMAASTDASDLLSLTSLPARIILYLFIATNVVFTLATLDRMRAPWPSFVALVLISVGALIVTRPKPDPLPWPDTLAVIGIVCASALVVSWYLPQSGELGREAWHLGAATWLLFFLALRRRARVAWLGMVLLTAITVWWGISIGQSAVFGLTLLQTHMGILLVATLFASSLRRTARIINTLTARSVVAAAVVAGADAGQEIRLQRVAELAALAVPQLELIASGAPLNDDDRRMFQSVEAQLRDGVRGRSLVVPAVAAAAQDARARGVTVNLLDDRGAPLPSHDAMLRLVDAVTSALLATTQGTVTARMLPEGRAVAVTILSDDGVQIHRASLDEVGEYITP